MVLTQEVCMALVFTVPPTRTSGLHLT